MIQEALDADSQIDLRRAHFQFVVAQINEVDLSEIQSLISDVTRVVSEHDATLIEIISSLVICGFGLPNPAGDSPQKRLQLVAALISKVGTNIRIIHGQCDGAYGLLGDRNCLRYTIIVPRLSGILKQLLETPFGLSVEV